MGHSAIIAAIAAVITGVFGGVLRDMFCNRIPLVFQKEIYAGISFSAARLYIGLQHLSLPHNLVVILTLVAGLSARLIALRFRLGLRCSTTSIRITDLGRQRAAAEAKTAEMLPFDAQICSFAAFSAQSGGQNAS